MTRLMTTFAFLMLATSAQATSIVLDLDNPLTVAKRLVHVLDDLADEAKDDADDLRRYDSLEAAKLKFLASRADKLADRVYVKIVKENARGGLTKKELAKAYKSLAHDIKNYQNALRKVEHPTRALLAKARKVDLLLEDLEELALGRGRIDVCRGNRCVSR